MLKVLVCYAPISYFSSPIYELHILTGLEDAFLTDIVFGCKSTIIHEDKVTKAQ